MLPKSDKKCIDIAKLSAIFNRTTNSYKYYWFISILELVQINPNDRIIPMQYIFCKMISNAWYPIHYFRLSFGVLDKLSQNVVSIQQFLKLSIDKDKQYIYDYLINNNEEKINQLILHFKRHVPHRFLTPWFPGLGNNRSKIEELSSTFENNCIYKLNYNNLTIEINPDWQDYLISNHKIVKDFCYWNLTLFLQKKNPNVPDIANKLIKPITKNSMLRERKYWNIILCQKENPRCFYTNEKISTTDYSLDHFIPWSFVSHNLLWNLIPVKKSINSSKGNKLPILSKYLSQFAKTQHEGIKIIYDNNMNDKRLEDFYALTNNIHDVISMPFDIFLKKYKKLMTPLVQIAENMGFEYWIK